MSSPPSIPLRERFLGSLFVGSGLGLVSVLFIAILELFVYYFISINAILLSDMAFFIVWGLYLLIGGLYLFFGESFSLQFILGLFSGNRWRYLEHDSWYPYLNGIKYIVASMLVLLGQITHQYIVRAFLF